MSEILSFPVVFSYHVPTASRTVPIVPIAPTIPIASEPVEAVDKSPLIGTCNPSTSDTSSDVTGTKKDEGLKAPNDIVVVNGDNADNHGELATVDVASSPKESNSVKEDGGLKSEGKAAGESSSAAEKDELSEKKNDVGTDNASKPERSDNGGDNEAEEAQQSDTVSATLIGPFITEVQAEKSRIEAEKKQKQWDRRMKSSIARFEKRRAGGGSYSRRPPNNANRSESNTNGEGSRRSSRSRNTKSKRGGDDDDDDYSEVERDSVSGENIISSGPAKDLPCGWTIEKVARSNPKGRKDRYWFSPILQKKFRSRVDVHRFLAKMEIAKDRLGTAKPGGGPEKMTGEEKAPAEVSEASEAKSPNKEGKLNEESDDAKDSISKEDQAKVEDLAWKLLVEDRAKDRAKRR